MLPEEKFRMSATPHRMHVAVVLQHHPKSNAGFAVAAIAELMHAENFGFMRILRP
jgi:hypothetical protein